MCVCVCVCVSVCECVYIQYIRMYARYSLCTHADCDGSTSYREEAYPSTKEVIPIMQTSGGGERRLNHVVGRSVHQRLCQMWD